MPRAARTWLAAALAATLSVAGCGGDEDSKPAGRAGGTINVSYSSFPDALDPALAATTEALQSLWTVYTPLLTYKHAEGAEGSTVVPGLAEAMPSLSPDGRTYGLKLREDLKYSDGTPVRASDFEHAIKRVLNLESFGSSFFLDILGAEKYVKAAEPDADIEGIATSDRTNDLTITLNEPDGRFPYILALNYAALVPGDTPFSNQTKSPPPGVGPYKLENVRVNRGWDVVKVPGFDVADQAVGRLDRIEVEIVKNRRRQTQDTIQNRIDYMSDPPAPDQLRDVRAKYTGTRYEEFVTNSTYFFFLNHDVAPFDQPLARQAVNHAIDKRATARLFGGLLHPSCNFLPPGVKGYEELDPCPYGDPTAAPDLEKAKALVKQAGVEGQPVTVWGLDQPEAQSLAEYLSDVLNQIGFKAKPRIIAGSVYFQTIGNAKTKAQTGFVNWFADFPHPGNFLNLVDGASIQATNSLNPGNVDDPKINALLKSANAKDIDDAAGDFAEADRLTVQGAHVVPYGDRKLTVLYSDRIDAENCTVWHPVYTLDLTKLCVK